MADRRRDDVAIIFEMVIVFFETAERASEIARDMGLLGNEKGFGHLEKESKLSFAVIAIDKRKTQAILAQFHKIFPGQLLYEPLQFKTEESRGDNCAWQIACGSNLINRRFGRIDRLINATLIFGERWQGADCGFRRWLCLGKKNLQVIENIARTHYELGPLLNQTIRPHRSRRVNVPRNSINGAALLDRLRRSNQRAAVQTRFDNKNAVTPAADDPIPHRKCLPIGFNLHRELLHDRTIAGHDLFIEPSVLRRINFEQSNADIGNGSTFRCERTLMRSRIDAARQTADDCQSGVCDLIRKL